MHNSSDYTTSQIDMLKSNMRELSTRLVIAETKVEILNDELNWKNQMKAILKNELAKMGYFIAGMAYVLLLIYICKH